MSYETGQTLKTYCACCLNVILLAIGDSFQPQPTEQQQKLCSFGPLPVNS